MNRIFTLTTLIAFFFAQNFSVHAQGNTDSKLYTKPSVTLGKEMGVRVDMKGDLGFTYLKHKNENQAFRFRTVSTGLTLPNVAYSNFSFVRGNLALGVGGAFAFLKKKKLDDKFTYYHGWEPFLGSYLTINHFGVYIGIGHTFGLTYDLSEKFNLNMEFVPNVGLGYAKYYSESNQSLLAISSSKGLSFSLHYKIFK